MKGSHIFVYLFYAIIITNVNSARNPANVGKGLLDCGLTCEDVTRKIKSLEDNFAVMRRTLIDLVKQNKKMNNLENSIEMKLENITSNFERETEALRHKLEEEVQKRMDLQDTVDTLQEHLNQTKSQLLESKGTLRSDDAKDIPKIIKKNPGSCYLQDLPEKEGVDLNGNDQVDSNEKADIVCHRGYILKYPDVFCVLGEWLTENNLSPCQKTNISPERCSVKDLPQKEGVDLTADKIVNSNEIADIACKKGYRLAFPNVFCTRGQWLTENEFSPCQPASCSLRDLPVKDGVNLTEDEPVNSDEKADISCEKGFMLAFPNVNCKRGKWITENDFSPCQPENCSLRDLPEKDGVDLTEDEPVNSDKKADIVCETGYTLSFPNVYCIRGKWLTENDISPCQPESCNLRELPENDGVDLTDELVNSDEKADIVCQKGYKLTFPNVYCKRGKWITENDLSPCQGESCSLSELPEKSAVDLTEDKVVNSGERADIACENGYRLAFPNVYCLRGKWIPENDLSPCQEEDCEVQPIENAEIKGIILFPGNKSGLRKEKKSKYQKVDIGSFQKSGDSLFVNCVDGYGFLDANVDRVKITCDKGRWKSLPECELLPTCNIGTLHDDLPEGVVPFVEEGMSEDIPFGRSVKLGCYKSGMVLKGDIFANCSTDGGWKIGNNIQCTQGCASYERKPGSELLLFPEKQFYDFGESILFSCPEGKALTKRVDRVQCSKQGWAPNVKPECV